MLVLVSDLHLTDERTARNVNLEAFTLFGAEVAATAKKRGARETTLVLLGDIIDLVRTDYWLRQRLSPDERPWGGKLDPSSLPRRAAIYGHAERAGTHLSGLLGPLCGGQSRPGAMELPHASG